MARLRGNRWQADALVDGIRQRKSFATEALAVAWENKHKAARELAEQAKEETFVQLAEALEVDLWGRGAHAVRSMQVIREAEQVLGPLSIGDFKTIHVQRLVNHYHKAGLSEGTINRKFAALSKLCRRAVKTDLLDKMPYFERRKEPRGRDRFLTPKEEDKLFGAIKEISQDSHDLVVFLVDTGCRLGEAFSLEWYQVDMDRGTVTFDKTKADLTRTVWLTSRVKAILERKKNAEKPFSLNRFTFRDHWNRGKIAAGFKDDPNVVPHILRHTCASRLVQAGVRIKLVQTQLGHKNLVMTERYSHLAPDALETVLGALESRGARA